MQKKFTEWIRYFMQNPYPDFDYATYVDKHKAKAFVKPVINIAREYAYFTEPEEIDNFNFRNLPVSFMIKATHGCKWFIEVKNKQMVKHDEAKSKMKSWLTRHYNPDGEKFYATLTPGVLIEEYLGDDLAEYKLWYIHGKLEFIEARKQNSANRAHYDKEWNRLPFVRKRQPGYFDAPKPNNLTDIISAGDNLVKLINDPPFIRIDLYSKKSCCTKKSKVYFSEYSFTPARGQNPFVPDEYEVIFGNKITEGYDLKKELPKHLGGHHNRNRVDEGTLNYLIERFNPKSLLDIGCGLGGTVELASNKGLDSAGIDGDWTVDRGGVADKVLIHDYTKGTIDTKDFNLGWSVEFMEHVEERYLPNIFHTFSKCDVIFCTHAVPRQPGYHHVNCQTSEYWINKFREYGFELMDEPTKKVREVSTHKRDYIKKTGMVFKNMNKNNMENLRVLCFTPSFKRAKMLRGCMQDVIEQSYKDLHHAINVTYKDPADIANYNGLLGDLTDGRDNIHIVYTKNQHNHTNYMNAIKADPNYMDYDLYIKIDDDDIHKKDYVKTVVDFFKTNAPDVVSSKVKYQLNGNLMRVNHSGYGTLGGNPEGSNFKMPMTFAFNRKALDVLLKIKNPDKLSGKLWRREWHNAGLNHQVMENRENIVWYIHGENITTANFLKKQ